MNNKLLVTLMAVLTCSPLFAQEGNTWEIYDTQTQKTTSVDITGLQRASIVGKDNRKNITGKAADFEKAAVVLEMKSRAGTSLCSGAMIGPNIVLTAAHCVTSSGKYFPQIKVFATGLGGGDTSVPPADSPNPGAGRNIQDLLSKIAKTPKKNKSTSDLLRILSQRTHAAYQQAATVNRRGNFPSADADKIWAPQEWIQATRNTNPHAADLEKIEPFDYAIIILDKNLGEQTGWMKIATKNANELRHQNIILLGRGGDKPSRTLWRADGKIGNVDARYIFHNADMVGGNSGGPVVLAADPYTIVGLNNFGPFATKAPEGTYPNGCLRINNKIINAVQHNR